MNHKLLPVLLLLCLFYSKTTKAEDGYRLWLRYDLIENQSVRQDYIRQIPSVYVDGESPVLNTAGKELINGLTGLLGQSIHRKESNGNSGIVAGIVGQSLAIKGFLTEEEIEKLKPEGFLVKNISNKIIIAGKDGNGVLYGCFYLLRLMKMNKPINKLSIIENPKIKLRVLNHWDNLDRTVERGYAGFSIWNWHQLPEYIDQRYYDYARANASIGINGTVVTNVNANALIFSEGYIEKAGALADVFRDYGIKLYLTARFSSPIELGKLETADPLNPEVIKWWKDKVNEIYKHIPDFGGFLVKANSEGQPGPQQYNRNHTLECFVKGEYPCTAYQ